MDSTSTARPPSTDRTAASDCTRSADHPLVNSVNAASRSLPFIARLYGPILDQLVDVEQRLIDELHSPYPPVAPVLQHGTQLGGKRLRPAMLLLSGAATGGLNDDHLVLATVIEMVHTATLVHDDILDGADTRRHVPTVNSRWNEHTSILLGDYLFAQSFRLAATLSSTEACRWIGEAARLVCEGELRQILRRDSLELDEDTYIDIIRGKTAELCRVACQLGAKHSGADAEQVTALGRFGNAVGIAFQIADDYLDLWGDDDSVGKTLGTDISQGKVTLPIIRLLMTATPRRRDEIIDILRGPAEQRLSTVLPYLARSDAQHYTREVADSYRREARRALDGLPESPAKSSLRSIADFAVDRSF